MTTTAPLRFLSRITIELDGPASIRTGDESDQSDMPFVVDASGLPAIPGSSLAGMLRARFEALKGPEQTEYIFGASKGSSDPEGSRIAISWAHVHDESDQPIDGRLSPETKSEFLVAVATGELRDRVAIDHRGTARDKGKFDQEVLYRGTRFTFEIELHLDEGEEDLANQVITDLVELLHGPSTRQGGSKHSGFGAFRVIRAQGKLFDLRDGEDFRHYGQLSSDLRKHWDLDSLRWEAREPDDLATITINLQPETFFFVGGGESIEGSEEDKSGAKIAPVRTQRISWRGGRGQLEKDPILYLPGSSIKGALAHRVAFHANRLTGHFAGLGINAEDFCGERNAVIRALFGFSLEDRPREKGIQPLSDDHRFFDPAEDDTSEERGKMGQVLIDDVLLEGHQTQTLIHISTDPFTGGVRHGFLFTEEAIQPSSKEITILVHVEKPETLDQTAKKALYLAIEDLRLGRLALGSGEGRGNGRFRGEEVRWPESLRFDTSEEVSTSTAIATQEAS